MPIIKRRSQLENVLSIVLRAVTCCTAIHPAVGGGNDGRS